jgi:hypothetical protein
MRTVFVFAVVLSCLAAAGLTTPAFANHQAAVVIDQALSAAPPELAKGGTVLDQEGDLLQESDEGWKRMPPPAHFQETPPRCNDGLWMEWAAAYLHTKDDAGATFGVCHMLASDEGASNIDPYAGEVKVIARTGASR